MSSNIITHCSKLINGVPTLIPIEPIEINPKPIVTDHNIKIFFIELEHHYRHLEMLYNQQLKMSIDNASLSIGRHIRSGNNSPEDIRDNAINMEIARIRVNINTLKVMIRNTPC